MKKSFWDYSLEAYARPGVADACLGLQDRLGVDVNLLLFACWVADCGGGALSRDDWRRLSAATSGWRTRVVEPLRAVRRYLKAAPAHPAAGAIPATLRDRVKGLELEAEHAEQLVLESLAERPFDPGRPAADRRADAGVSLESCFAALDVHLADADRADTDIILDSCA
jgi:uncharacterized protein (TIGR02444 family)